MKTMLRLTMMFGFALTACQRTPSTGLSPILRPAFAATHPPTHAPAANPARIPSLPGSLTTDPEQEKLIRLAIQDLSLRLNIPGDQIRILAIGAAVWTDSNLGCPNSDRVATPGKVSGFSIVLEAGGVEYVYHTGHPGQIILCPPEKPAEPGLR